MRVGSRGIHSSRVWTALGVTPVERACPANLGARAMSIASRVSLYRGYLNGYSGNNGKNRNLSLEVHGVILLRYADLAASAGCGAASWYPVRLLVKRLMADVGGGGRRSYAASSSSF